MAKQIHIRLSEAAVKDLEALKKKLGVSSVTEVVRSSVSLAKFLEMEKAQGNEIVLRNKKTHKEKSVVMVK